MAHHKERKHSAFSPAQRHLRNALTLILLASFSESLKVAQAAAGNHHRHKLPAQTQRARKNQKDKLSIKEIENCRCLIPNLGSGEDWEVQLKNGHYKRGPVLVQGRERGELSHIAVGELNGKPGGAALLTWSTGGTGIWKNLILFQKVKGKVRGTQAYALVYPLNKGTVTALKFADNKLSLDLAEIPLEARGCITDNDIENVSGESSEQSANTRIISKEEALNALVCGPSQEELNSEGSVSRSFQLRAGSYSDQDMTCKIERVIQTSKANEPFTLAVGLMKYGSSRPPVFIAFSLKRKQGKISCENCYTLSSQYCNLSYQKVTALKLEQTSNNSTLRVSLVGIKIKPSDFTPASYLKSSTQ